MIKKISILSLLFVAVTSSIISDLFVNNKDWWEAGNFYQIYPRSFKDSDGDGIGDLKGVIQKLPYLKELGITATWLSPIFKSPMADFGYDISDYYTIQPEYGTNADLEELVKKANSLGIKIILDFVPNHTSDEHDWFILSANRTVGYENYYIWHPGKTDASGNRLPPNNWNSVFHGSAWEWNEIRQEYYYHQFVVKQPDLNYREPKVVEGMKEILRFWLGKGVSGFRIDAVPYLFEVELDEDSNYPDEPISGLCEDAEAACYLTHIYTQDIPETFEMIYQWRDVLDQFTKTNGGDNRILMTEAYTALENIIKFYGNATREGSQIPFNFEVISNVNNESTAADFQTYINRWLDAVPTGRISNWVMGNHDQKRLASRFGTNRADLLNILVNTLPGIAVTYNGEELAMTDVFISWEDTIDPAGCNTNADVYLDYSRDPARTPFQWDGTTSAGFSTSTNTWLPVSPDYKSNNVEVQKLQQRSHLKLFKKLLRLRKTKAFQDSDFESALLNDNVLVFKRVTEHHLGIFIVVLNFSETSYTVDLSKLFYKVPSMLAVIGASVESHYNDGNIIRTNNILAEPGVGLILGGLNLPF